MSAEDHAAARVRLAAAAAADAAARWAQVDPDNIARTWTAQIPATLTVVSASQLAAAGSAEDYLDEFAEPADVEVDPHAYAGVASDGGSLASLLYQPAIGALMSIGSGASVGRALAGGQATLDMIVRTQVADAGRAADQAALTARPAVTGYVRQIVGATCSRCTILAGRFYRWNAGFQRHPRCFPAGAVVAGPSALAATRRWYQGELVVLATAGGQQLALTGNHPVLTGGGWLPANLLREGDEVVRSTRPEGATPLVRPDHHQMPARIQDVWRALSVASFYSVESTPEDFHGDGQHGQVDVVGANRPLNDRHRASVPKRGEQYLLGWAPGSTKTFDSQGSAVLLDLWNATHAGSPVGGNRLCNALLGGQLLIANQAGGTHVATLDAGAREYSRDWTPRDAVLPGEAVFTGTAEIGSHDGLGRQIADLPRWDAPGDSFSVETAGGYATCGLDLLQRLAGQVEMDRVVELRRVEWSGHVYSLTSSEGWHSADSLIVSNCNCVHVPATRAQWREQGRFHDAREVYDRLSVAERQRAGWSLADQKAIDEGADLIHVTNMKGVTTAGSRRSAGKLTTDQIYKLAGGNRDEAIRLLRSNGYLRGAPSPSAARPVTFDARTTSAARDGAALRAAPANAGRRIPGNIEVTRSEQAALRDYIGSFFVAINGNLRRQTVSDYLRRTIDRLDAVMARSLLKREVLVWRGMQDGARLFGGRLAGDLTGFEWRELGYVSTSAAETVARSFMVDQGQRVLMRMLVPRGTGAVQLSRWSEFASGAGDQAELLLRRGLRLRVVADRGISPAGYRLLDVEVLP